MRQLGNVNQFREYLWFTRVQVTENSRFKPAAARNRTILDQPQRAGSETQQIRLRVP